MDIKTAIDKFMLANRGKRAPMTIRAYRNALNSFISYLVDHGIETTSPLEDLNIEHFIEYSEWISGHEYEPGKQYSKKTIGVYTAGIKIFMDWMVIKGTISPNYQESLRFKMAYGEARNKRESKMPRFPKKDDIEKMIEAARTMKEKSPRKERNIALVELLASSGCRISEVIALDIKNIDTVERSAVVTGKGSKERRIYFSSKAMKALNHYWQKRGFTAPADPVFCRHDKGTGKHIQRMTPTTARTMIKEIAAVAGIDAKIISPHYFRHDFAIKMLRKSNNLALVQDLLGHSSPSATRVYAKIYPDEMRDAHRKLFK